MSRRVALPTDDDLAAALHAVLADATASGARPTVLNLAGRLGLSNTTFWRHFPDTARQVRASADAVAASADPDAEADNPTASGGSDHAAHSSDAQRLAALSRENQQLREQLDLACAHIARLTLTNQGLGKELEAVTSVTPLFPPRPTSTNNEAGRSSRCRNGSTIGQCPS